MFVNCNVETKAVFYLIDYCLDNGIDKIDENDVYEALIGGTDELSSYLEEVEDNELEDLVKMVNDMIKLFCERCFW